MTRDWSLLFSPQRSDSLIRRPWPGARAVLRALRAPIATCLPLSRGQTLELGGRANNSQHPTPTRYVCGRFYKRRVHVRPLGRMHFMGAEQAHPIRAGPPHPAIRNGVFVSRPCRRAHRVRTGVVRSGRSPLGGKQPWPVVRACDASQLVVWSVGAVDVAVRLALLAVSVARRCAFPRALRVSSNGVRR